MGFPRPGILLFSMIGIMSHVHPPYSAGSALFFSSGTPNEKKGDIAYSFCRHCVVFCFLIILLLGNNSPRTKHPNKTTTNHVTSLFVTAPPSVTVWPVCKWVRKKTWRWRNPLVNGSVLVINKINKINKNPVSGFRVYIQLYWFNSIDFCLGE